MTAINHTIANSHDGNTLSMFEYWDFMRMSVNAQQAEGELEMLLINIKAKETIPISFRFTFQISPASKYAVTYLHNAYLSLDIEPQFLYIIDTKLAYP